MNEKQPKKFVGLHSHSTFSIGDAIGMPQDHIDFARENGMDAIALTDHGNMNGYSHQYFYNQKLKKEGIKFKAIPGIEAYFVDSLSEWSKLYESDKEKKRLTRLAAKGDTEAAEALRRQEELLGDPFAETKTQMDDDLAGGTVVENEEESKSNKYKDPLKQRNHLVLLPKNREGLQALFQLVTESYVNGFYRYPRIDLELLKKYSKGNIIALTACIEGSALLQTNVGLITLKEVVRRVSSNEEIFVVSYCEKEKRQKFSRVVWGDLTRKKAKLVQITLEDGKTVKCTPDHRFYTNHGWLRVDELKKFEDTCILTND